MYFNFGGLSHKETIEAMDRAILEDYIDAQRRLYPASCAERITLGGAFALCLAPLWIFHLVLFGEPFGPHITSQAGGISAAAYLSERPTTIRNFLVNSHGSPWWSALAAAPFWLCVAAGGGLSQRGFRIGVPLAALGGLLSAAISQEECNLTLDEILWSRFRVRPGRDWRSRDGNQDFQSDQYYLALDEGPIYIVTSYKN